MIGIIILAIFVSLIIITLLIVFSKDLSNSVVLFMGFGLGSTILYFLFSSPDVALTEAVIGAGLSSVVFLVTILQTKIKEKI